MSRIRLLHLIGQLRRGGCESQLLGLCERMDKGRFDLSICWYTPMEDELDEAFTRAGVRTFFFDKFSMPVWRFFRRLRGVIGEVRPDIVQTWLYSANFWGRWAAMSCRVPHILATDRNEVDMNRWVDRMAERFLAPHTLRLANSLAVAQSLERAFNLPVEQTRIIPNAVKLPEVDQVEARRSIREELHLHPHARIVLMVGRTQAGKNYQMFIRAGRQVCAELADVFFLAAGTGPQEAELRDLVQQEGLAGRIMFLGSRHDVPRLLAAADVFCFTSNSEGLPNAVIEAMATGLPVVCTAFPAAREVIPTSDLGILVPLNDDQAMAGEVVRLLKNDNVRNEFSRKAREHTRACFTWERVVRNTEALYEEIMKNGRSSM